MFDTVSLNRLHPCNPNANLRGYLLAFLLEATSAYVISLLRNMFYVAALKNGMEKYVELLFDACGV